MLEAELKERDRWTRDDLLAYQRERVRALVSHAVNPFRVATTFTTGRRSIVAFTHDQAAVWRAASARPMMRMGIGAYVAVFGKLGEWSR
jgi:hypothetical protein